MDEPTVHLIANIAILVIIICIPFFIANHSKCDNCTEKESEFGGYQPTTDDLNDNDPPNDE